MLIASLDIVVYIGTVDFYSLEDLIVLTVGLIFFLNRQFNRDNAGTWKHEEKQYEFKLKSSLWCFFHTRRSVVSDTFLRHSSFRFLMWPPPSDTSKKAAPTHRVQIKACFAQFISQWQILHWQKLVYSPTLAWCAAGNRSACSWNVVESQQPTEVVWF